MAMDQFLGTWEVTHTENMDEMLCASDMEEQKRKLYSDTKFTMEYTRTGEHWSYTVYMPHGVKKVFNFTLGSEFDSTTLDGRPIVSLINADNGRFVEVHKDKADPTLDAQMTREVKNDQLIVTAKVRNITSTTFHKKVM